MKTYIADKEFLEKHLSVTELSSGDKRLIVSPDLQGRVMTSTCGRNGYSFGWLNYDLIRSGAILPHCNNYGGEDRFWIGPEGGQYSWFFKKGSDFSFDNWQTPPVIDTEPWPQIHSDGHSALFRKQASLLNYTGNSFDIIFERRVSFTDIDTEITQGVDYVEYTSENKLTNNGDLSWNETTGMPSIWILGQFTPSPGNTIIIPFVPVEGEDINDAYFGRLPCDRLWRKDNILYFRGDGLRRGKIGIPPSMTLPMCCALDKDKGTLTIVTFSFDTSKTAYVNSMWEHQDEPFKGDVINAYNDGPLEDGSVMGPFYELETSSPALALCPGESYTHTHTTEHYTGPVKALEEILRMNLENFKHI